MKLEKVTMQVEIGPNVSRLTVRHPERITPGELGAFFIDTGLRMVKQELDLEEPDGDSDLHQT